MQPYALCALLTAASAHEPPPVACFDRELASGVYSASPPCGPERFPARCVPDLAVVGGCASPLARRPAGILGGILRDDGGLLGSAYHLVERTPSRLVFRYSDAARCASGEDVTYELRGGRLVGRLRPWTHCGGGGDEPSDPELSLAPRRSQAAGESAASLLRDPELGPAAVERLLGSQHEPAACDALNQLMIGASDALSERAVAAANADCLLPGVRAQLGRSPLAATAFVRLVRGQWIPIAAALPGRVEAADRAGAEYLARARPDRGLDLTTPLGQTLLRLLDDARPEVRQVALATLAILIYDGNSPLGHLLIYVAATATRCEAKLEALSHPEVLRHLPGQRIYTVERNLMPFLDSPSCPEARARAAYLLAARLTGLADSEHYEAAQRLAKALDGDPRLKQALKTAGKELLSPEQRRVTRAVLAE